MSCYKTFITYYIHKLKLGLQGSNLWKSPLLNTEKRKYHSCFHMNLQSQASVLFVSCCLVDANPRRVSIEVPKHRKDVFERLLQRGMNLRENSIHEGKFYQSPKLSSFLPYIKEKKKKNPHSKYFDGYGKLLLISKKSLLGGNYCYYPNPTSFKKP